MRKLFTGLLILLSVSIYASDHSKRVKVLSFNIYHGETMKGNFDLGILAGVINDAEADLVSLQEVDFKTGRARNMDLALELGYLTKRVPLFGRAMDFSGGEYGVGLLSVNSLLSSVNHALPYSKGGEPRAALMAKVRLASGDTIAFISTHLDHRNDSPDRMKQTEYLIKLVEGCSYPVILAGDLNAEPDADSMKRLKEVMAMSADGNIHPTYPSDEPRKKIDYIMYYPADHWKVIRTEVIANDEASDHRPYFAELELMR